MSDPKEKEPLTFDEFLKMCEQVGVKVPDMEQMENDYRMGRAIADVVEELSRTLEAYPVPMRSAHEGFSLLQEEIDELWDHVKVKQGGRDVAAMRKEAIQAAAMAIRFASDICHDEAGQN